MVYRAYNDESVNLTSGREIDLSAAASVSGQAAEMFSAEAAEHIRQIDLNALGLTELGEMYMFGHGTNYYYAAQVAYPKVNNAGFYCGSVPLKPARYPNNDYLLTERVISEGVLSSTDMAPSVFTVDSDTKSRMASWKTDNAWMYGYFYSNYSDISLPIASIDKENGIVTTQKPSPKAMKTGGRYYFYNIPQELDSPGEYFIDEEQGVLYFYPPNDGELWVSESKAPAVKISNASNIVFDGIKIEYAREHAVTIKNSLNISFRNCTVCNAASRGLSFMNCVKCDVSNCKLFNTEIGAVEFDIADVKTWGRHKNTLTPTDNIVENCEIYDFGIIQRTYSPAVLVKDNGVKIIGNKIHGSDHSAIILANNDQLIADNEIYDCVRATGDAGVIYAGYNKEHRGLVIRNNYFHDFSSNIVDGTGISAIYMDDLKDDCTVTENLFVDIKGKAVMLNGGRNNTVTDNIFINVKTALTLTANGLSTTPWATERYNLDKFTFCNYLDNPQYAKYSNFPDLLEDDWNAPKYNIFKRNVIINCENDYILGNLSNTTTTSETILADNTLEDSTVMSDATAGTAIIGSER